MSAVTDFLNACSEQAKGFDRTTYTFERSLVLRVRYVLINLNVDEAQENFLLGILSAAEPTLTLEAHYVDHIREYLKGALHAHGH